MARSAAKTEGKAKTKVEIPAIVMPIELWPRQAQKCWHEGTDPIPGLHPTR